jgi:hypothetical protein
MPHTPPALTSSPLPLRNFIIPLRRHSIPYTNNEPPRIEFCNRPLVNTNNKPSKPQTIESLVLELPRLSEGLEDLEDLVELRAAVARNEPKPGTPWEKVKPEILTD